jgi:DNA-directed RNA polymerase specialized sigma subunit
MIRLTIEGQIRQEGENLVMERQELEMETIEQAIAEVARQLGREPERHEIAVHGHGEVWAII